MRLLKKTINQIDAQQGEILTNDHVEPWRTKAEICLSLSLSVLFP